MAEKKLVDYVKSLIQKGYDVSAVRGVLLKYGYPDKEIDEAVSLAYHPTIRHEIHLSHTTALVMVFIFASLLGIASIYFYSAPKETKLLDLNLEPVSAIAHPGESISFIKELSNLGSSKRYDVVIKQEVIARDTNKVVTQKIETRAIETFGSSQTKILIPKETKPGDYILRAIVEYDSKKAVATLPVKIVLKATCFDGIQNQDEEGIDCGGVCKPCGSKAQAIECDDGNPCTADAVENGVCIHTPIAPCCGNGVCEAGEQETCPSDCKSAAAASSESLDDIKELAKSNPQAAMQQCSSIEVPDLKDACISSIGEAQGSKEYCMRITSQKIRGMCYSSIAKSTNDNSLCGEIAMDSTRDSCYMEFVLDNKDYSVCGRITNEQLRQSCESLRQLSELNQQSPQNQQSQ